MIDNIELYKIWAPDESKWAQWAKPVMFMNLDVYKPDILAIPKLKWIHTKEYDTVIIVDQPSKSGIEAGLALVRLGYRPVPLYNGVYNRYDMIVPVDDISAALRQGAEELITSKIQPDAPPVFLLDSNRMEGHAKEPGRFDNRWCVFLQDMPSASFLLDNMIRRINVYTDIIRTDLAHILFRYQEKGIAIYQCNKNEHPKEVTVTKPSGFGRLSYRFKVTLGLVRNTAGGFGSLLPEYESSDGRYFRYG